VNAVALRQGGAGSTPAFAACSCSALQPVLLRKIVAESLEDGMLWASLLVVANVGY